jgi:hypothetical protein
MYGGESFKNLCIFHVLDGLRDGLSHFSGPSRAALVYAAKPDDPVRVFDPQHLLRGHEPKLRELYLDSGEWRETARKLARGAAFEAEDLPDLQLAGLISRGAAGPALAHQMWFTEHHPDMCSTGPTQRWLEYACGLLAQDMAAQNVSSVRASGYVLREYATHAVRDYIVDRRNEHMGLDTSLRVYPILDAVLAVSKTMEEGAWPQGRLVFVEPEFVERPRYLLRFPVHERPSLDNSKHVRKLLQSVEGSDLAMVSDGRRLIGIAAGDLPVHSLSAEFRSGYGFLRLYDEPVCSFSDGGFRSGNRKAKLVQLEEILLESDLDAEARHALFRIVRDVVDCACEARHGCTLVLDLAARNGADEPRRFSGQHMEQPLDLRLPEHLELAKALSRVDGALHLGADCRLHGFACLLDGEAVWAEDRARGARYNSALRFTAPRDDLAVVVVSSDRPVSIIQNGVELTAKCVWNPVAACESVPPLLEDWIKG